MSEPTKEMVDFFEERMHDHIRQVGEAIDKIIEHCPYLKTFLEERKKLHDCSKFEEPERSPYIWITWFYKLKAQGIKFDYPDDIKDKVVEATNYP